MRVVHWYPNFGGGGSVAMSVLELANAQARDGAEVWISSRLHAGGDSPVYGPLQPSEDVHISHWRGRGSIGWRQVQLHLMGASERRLLREIKPDIVHAHGEFNADNWWAPGLFPCPLVLAPHGAFHPKVRTRGAATKALYIAAARRVLYRRVARFHALTPAEARDIEQLVMGSSIYCLPNASTVVGRRSREVRRMNGSVAFLFLGRMDVDTKGLDVLVDAFARVAQRGNLGRRVTLSLVGPDHRDGKSRLRELARRAEIAGLVDIAPPVAWNEVLELMEQFDVYVQLSRNDACPRSVADALVLGMPAIVSDAVGLMSYDEISRQPHVRLVSPTVSDTAAAIDNVVRNIDGLRTAARRARAEVGNFLSDDRVARLHLREYESILDESSR